ncbi:2-C-methyl-D-erythritol 4-phosphate cytidylyltransferase [Niallia endozanthoxylica]|uniref:2-C-methyl-D-erythritol 4-phosphate cytidylyltransferase n=1 Tax=Niallia endozanthoxylica TaxID=2036016 RepID=A0A5J5HFD6_9BACI|nr:2-C-methyl-D-erythritol 4-phosphate cytidylyltransferase [Niallia endozanthoxylica]KAA9018708.1 2-C-methyl-D-erythritol 4-phosphate cytidylyltransferase [Niallia endozanthoxylica]
MPYQVVIPAAGQGKRMGAGKNKLLLELDGVPVLIHTLQVFEADENCSGVILAVNEQDEKEFDSLLKKYAIRKVVNIVRGGSERQYSIYNGIKVIQSNEIVLVHDGARPFIDKDQIHSLVLAAEKYGASVLAVPVKDTVKKVREQKVIETVERSSLWAIQTPQAFRMPLLRQAYELAEEAGFLGTDDASLVERIGHDVIIVEGNYDNIKITTPEDLFFAETIIRKRRSMIKRS